MGNVVELRPTDSTEVLKEVVTEVSVLKYPVIEIFDSIQGEGSMIGLPVTFIRMAGCNLKCPWCDSKNTWMPPCRHTEVKYNSSYEMRTNDMSCVQCGAQGSLEELRDLEVVSELAPYKWMTIDMIKEYLTQETIVITGGEPCLQDLEPLLQAINDKHLTCIETNGTLPTPPSIGWTVASPKPPEYRISGECFFNELKYVVDDVFNIDCIPPEALKTMYGAIWLQPCDYGKDSAENIAKTTASWRRCYELAMANPGLRVGLQLHKLIDVR